MSPRSYQMGRRQTDVDETRRRVVEAARELLAETGTFAVDAVARRADVARATVYYQFGSKVGLLQALCDHLAERGGMERLAEVFTLAEPRKAIEEFVRVMGGFWATDRVCTRRLRALAALDDEVGQVIAARDEMRHRAAGVLAGGLGAADGRDDLVDMLYTLTSFETFDTLARGRALDEATPAIIRLVHGVIDGG
ncbi:TetR/AcrR family transcriptional regulator [Streptosporangium sp. NPDC000396]|uniref:TetR/AcrR family transcriptional regulator n=1 Tax=Streptosporangium sp. NPDC000396 TaxID=3366185 RepID=UPI0036A06AD8